jgi:hypothetical protein
MGAAYGIDRFVELRHEPGAILRCHRRRPTGQDAALPEIVHKPAHPQRLADVVVREEQSLRTQSDGSLRQAADGQGDVRGDGDVPQARSAIQSSTAPKPGQTINSTSGSAGTRSGALATTLTRVAPYGVIQVLARRQTLVRFGACHDSRR